MGCSKIVCECRSTVSVPRLRLLNHALVRWSRTNTTTKNTDTKRHNPCDVCWFTVVAAVYCLFSLLPHAFPAFRCIHLFYACTVAVSTVQHATPKRIMHFSRANIASEVSETALPIYNRTWRELLVFGKTPDELIKRNTKYYLFINFCIVYMIVIWRSGVFQVHICSSR